MKITLRLIFALVIAVAFVAGVSTYLTVQSEKKRVTSELEHRAWLAAEGLKESAGPLIAKGPSKKLDRIIGKMGADKQMFGIAVYNAAGEVVAVSKGLADKLPQKPDIVFEEFKDGTGRGSYEGIWPLCHIAHTRPLFRINDWVHYQEVNMKFAKAIEGEIDRESYIFI